MPISALIQLNEPAYLPVDAGVNFFVRPENIHDALMVDKLFNNVSRNEQAYEIGTGNKGPKVSRLELDFEFLRIQDLLKGQLDLVLQVPLLMVSMRRSSISFIEILSASSSIL